MKTLLSVWLFSAAMAFRIVMVMGFCWVLVLASPPAICQTVQVGKANFRSDLPPDSEGNPRRLMKAKPLLSDRFEGAVPTNDWCSSLVWPSNSPHSLPMFPHPQAVQAHAEGLGIGYNPIASVSDSSHENKVFQRGTSYKFPYRESLVVGLGSLKSPNTVLDQHSDWTVTALWQQDSDQLRATYGHGLPFVYFERNSRQPIQVEFKAAKVNRNEQPVEPLVFRLSDVTGPVSDANGKISLQVNAGKNVGVGSKARISYDYDGDSKTDRVETFALMATDPSANTWEEYSSEKNKMDGGLSRGERRDFQSGTITLEFWKCFGEGDVQLKLDQCSVELPIENGKRFLTADGKLATKSGSGVATIDGEKKTGKAAIFYRESGVVGVTVNGTHYGLFAPTGSKWKSDGQDGSNAKSTDKLSSDLAGKDYFSVAVLPDNKPETIQSYRKYAYSFVTDSLIRYLYEPKSAAVLTKFEVKTDVKEGADSGTLFALYRHQHLHLADRDAMTQYRYESPRGTMKVVRGKSFITKTPFLGVLPSLPNATGSAATLGPMIDRYVKDLTTREKTFESDDTYWNGKEFGKISEVIQIAEQLGKTDVRDQLVSLLEKRMEDWFDGNDKFFFYYDKTWNTLIGYPDSYGSADMLNDHHFHYSYFIKAAATIAQFDPEWVRDENYGGMIDLLIRNCANYDRSDKRFPWMRFFDPYAGHSWASGNAAFASGNNQESSSESMNFATALILYGEATGNKKIRDLGIYWHATEAEAIRNYWFDTDQAVFPDGYGHPCVGMVWGDGGTYGTWWTANPEEIHGINYLPVTAGALYLGRNADYVKRNFEAMLKSNENFHRGGFDGDPSSIDRWHDVLHEYLALADPVIARNRHSKNGQEIKSEFGETKVHTHQWLSSLGELGHFDEQVRADHPMAVAFTAKNGLTYVVYNAGQESVKVTFSNGKVFDVPSGLHSFKK